MFDLRGHYYRDALDFVETLLPDYGEGGATDYHVTSLVFTAFGLRQMADCKVGDGKKLGWKWPIEQLRGGDLFGGEAPWEVLVRRAFELSLAERPNDLSRRG